MSFGQTDPDDRGSWQQRPPRYNDNVTETREPGTHYSPPPVTTSPPAQPQEVVDDAFLANIARQNLPKTEELQEFITWSRNELPELTETILQASGVDVTSLVTEMNQWLATIKESEKKLNQKDVPASHRSPIEWPPMPGVSKDDVCTSTFDVNDLAMRGRKSVLTKQLYLPAIFPQMVLDTNQKWAFGQKVAYRQEWRHEGFTLGQLISSLSLLPNEELTLEVSSWQRTKTEITNETNQETRQQLEREMRQTDEESVSKEASASQGWTVSATGSVGLGPYSASVSAEANGNVSERTEQAERQVREATTKAVNEISLKRAVKMTQSSESGSEQRTTRRIKNPNSCHTVTFNFFQIVKLYDVQMRLENDAPILILPGIFPARYKIGGEEGQPIMIPYWTIESFTSPAVFLTQFFDVDRDLSEDIHGLALRVRIDLGKSPASAITQLIQALIVGTKYLLKLDPAAHAASLAEFVQNYVASTRSLRQRTAENYGGGRGQSEQMTTPGIYVDSMLGRCTACEDYVEASRYVDVMRQYKEIQSIERGNALTDLELQRRQKLLEAKKYEPFEPTNTGYDVMFQATNSEPPRK